MCIDNLCMIKNDVMKRKCFMPVFPQHSLAVFYGILHNPRNVSSLHKQKRQTWERAISPFFCIISLSYHALIDKKAAAVLWSFSLLALANLLSFLLFLSCVCVTMWRGNIKGKRTTWDRSQTRSPTHSITLKGQDPRRLCHARGIHYKKRGSFSRNFFANVTFFLCKKRAIRN